MSARLILSVLAVGFLGFALIHIGRNEGRIDPASRTWLLIAVIFGAVSAWLWTDSGAR